MLVRRSGSARVVDRSPAEGEPVLAERMMQLLRKVSDRELAVSAEDPR